MKPNNTAVAKIETPVAATSTQPVAGTPYYQLVVEAATVAGSFSNTTLDFYWKLGAKVNELQKSPDKYGNRKIINFMADVERLCKFGLGKTTFYSAGQINQFLTKAQLEEAKASKMSVTRTLCMCTDKLTNEQRQAILLEAKNHQGPQIFDVKAVVEQKIVEATGGTVTPKEDKTDDPEKKAKRIIKGAEHLIQVTTTKLKLVGEAMELVCRGDNEKDIKAAREQWESASVEFDELSDVWQKQVNKATKALDKVKTLFARK